VITVQRPSSTPVVTPALANALEVTGLAVIFGGEAAIDNITFSLQRGERVALVGPNGAGKSTLLGAIAGLLQPSRGRIVACGGQPRGGCIAYIPQRNRVDWTFPVNIADVVMMGRIGRFGLMRWPRPSDWDYVHQSLQVVGMRDLAKRQIGELSGGQQQRVFIARALAQEAQLMLMDEPLTGLDMPSQTDVLHTLDTLRERQVTVLVATHDLGQAADRFDRVLLINHKLVGFGTPTEVFTPERLAEAYGGHLHIIPGSAGVTVVGDTCCGCGEERQDG
jgi:manganese/iron transport system ATP-binding protein